MGDCPRTPGTRVGRLGSVFRSFCVTPMALNPLSVLGGISLSSLPESLAELIDSCLALLPAGQPFHSYPGTSGIKPITVHPGSGIVSVLEPTISHCASQRRGSAWREEFPQEPPVIHPPTHVPILSVIFRLLIFPLLTSHNQ